MIDIAVTPPEIEGLSVDDYEVVSERVHCRLAALECRHVVIRYRHVTVKIRETGALAGAPAREGVFKNNCADVSFVAALLIDKFLWHLPLYRQHRMLARRRHRRQPGLAEPVGQPGDRAVEADPRRAVAFGAAERRDPDGRDADPGRAGIRGSPAA